MRQLVCAAILCVSASSLVGCATPGYSPYGYDNSGFHNHKRALAGAAIGAAGGALVGNAVTHDAGGALVGGAVGATVGGLVGHSMDRKANRKQYRDDRYRPPQQYDYYR